ncbi:MAG: LysR family transcriptional regulator [Flavobacteriales bacterium]|nr:LysR family transcriptional regulator [Flavobacteriales bacterium]MCB0795935.1 LysR family transcriptional regulator [Flavobacteriales bacterium]
MNYTLHQLRIFLEVVRTGSITRAAEALYLSQPAVSIQLRNLQSQFEVPLIVSKGRSVQVTPFGREIAEAAERIVEEVSAIEHLSMAHRGLLTGTLRVAVVSTGKYVMPYFLTSFLEQHPGLELVMDVTNKAAVIHSLREHEVDLALVSILPTDMVVHELELMRNQLYLIAGRRLSQVPKRATVKDLTLHPMIFREEGSGTRWTMDNFLSKQGAPVKKRLELTSNEAVKQAVLAGLGWSIMPLIGIRQQLDRGDLRIVPMKGLPIETRWRLIWRPNATLSPASLAFLDHLRQEKDAIIHEHFTWYEKEGTKRRKRSVVS